MSATTTAPGDKAYDEIRARPGRPTTSGRSGRTRSPTRRATAARARICGPGTSCGPRSTSAMKITTPAAVERRVLQLVDPENDSPASGTTTNITATCKCSSRAKRRGRIATP